MTILETGPLDQNVFQIKVVGERELQVYVILLRNIRHFKIFSSTHQQHITLILSIP